MGTFECVFPRPDLATRSRSACGCVVPEVVMPSLTGVFHRDVDVGGLRLHVAEAGAGPPLLLLHGWPQHWWCWRRVVPELSRRYRVLMPDLRGFGWSEAPRGSYSKHTFATDILGLLDVEGLDRVRVIGHDWGGYTALVLALGHPERIERLLALDIAPPWPQRSTPGPRHLALPLLASYQVLLGSPLLGQRLLTSGTGLVRTLIRAGSGPTANWTSQELDTYADVLRDPARAGASSACYRTFLSQELPMTTLRGDRSSELQVPTLLATVPEEAPHAVLDLAHRWLDRQSL
jgi:pimeloyl-ACP methyl ester carboxylesterase